MCRLGFCVHACFNTQPPEGGWDLVKSRLARFTVSTHSRLKAAGEQTIDLAIDDLVSTHSRLKAAGKTVYFRTIMYGFQHTAA